MEYVDVAVVVGHEVKSDTGVVEHQDEVEEPEYVKEVWKNSSSAQE